MIFSVVDFPCIGILVCHRIKDSCHICFGNRHRRIFHHHDPVDVFRTFCRRKTAFCIFRAIHECICCLESDRRHSDDRTAVNFLHLDLRFTLFKITALQYICTALCQIQHACHFRTHGNHDFFTFPCCISHSRNVIHQCFKNTVRRRCICICFACRFRQFINFAVSVSINFRNYFCALKLSHHITCCCRKVCFIHIHGIQLECSASVLCQCSCFISHRHSTLGKTAVSVIVTQTTHGHFGNFHFRTAVILYLFRIVFHPACCRFFYQLFIQFCHKNRSILHCIHSLIPLLISDPRMLL